MSYVRKMGASALVVAAAFAVAFAVLLSSPGTAEAVVQTRDGTSFTALTGNASNGQTVYIQNDAAEYVQFEITTVGAASATFTHASATNNGQTIVCDPGSRAGDCDADTVHTGVTVGLKIDDDSGAGAVFVKQTLPGTPSTAATVDTITVVVAQVPTKLTVTPSPKAVNSGEGAAQAGTSVLSIRLTDANGKGIGGKGLTIIASHGALSVATAPTTWPTDVSGGVAFTGTGSQVGSIPTSTDSDTTNTVDGAGYAAVTFTAGGVPNVATITVRVTGGTLDNTAEITMFGAVKTLTAESEQSAIAIGESTFVVVTAKDAGGNPVAGATASTKSLGGIVGPDPAGTKVSVARDVNKDLGVKGTIEKGDIPACDTTVTAVTTAEQTDGEPPLRFASTGTNADGQCVLRVTAPDNTGTANDASRGTHSITIVSSADGTDPASVDAVTLDIQVGGAPAVITSDAPERIDPSDEREVNITVVDDEAVRVGAVLIQVDQTAGDGKIIVDAASSTKDGKAKFTYLAPSTAGKAEFLVRTFAKKADGTRGVLTAKLPIIINIGEEEAAPEPEPEHVPGLDRTPASTGYTLVVFNGGSVAELDAVLTDACGSSAEAYATNLGSYVSYLVGAPSIVNRAFNDLFADGIPAGEPLLVGNCGS